MEALLSCLGLARQRAPEGNEFADEGIGSSVGVAAFFFQQGAEDQFGNGFEQSLGFGIRLDIHIDGFCPPAKKQCGRSTGEVNRARSLDALTKGSYELLQLGFI